MVFDHPLHEEEAASCLFNPQQGNKCVAEVTGWTITASNVGSKRILSKFIANPHSFTQPSMSHS